MPTRDRIQIPPIKERIQQTQVAFAGNAEDPVDAVRLVVFENNTYASIRIHQERDYPGRTIGTSFCRTEAVRRAMLSLTAGWEAVYDP